MLDFAAKTIVQNYICPLQHCSSSNKFLDLKQDKNQRDIANTNISIAHGKK